MQGNTALPPVDRGGQFAGDAGAVAGGAVGAVRRGDAGRGGAGGRGVAGRDSRRDGRGEGLAGVDQLPVEGG